jgi:carboxymethylenebutenolidase
MAGSVTFAVGERQIPGYLALPASEKGPGILVLHAWWGLNEFFRTLCERFAQEGFVVFAPDLYHGRGPVQTIEQAEEIMPTLHQDEAFADITAAVSYLLAQPQTSGSSVGVVGFSMGGAYALDMSVTLAEEIAAVVTFYATYPGLDYRSAKAAYLCHFAEDDPFEPAESVAQMEQDLQAAGRMVTVSTYPGTKHWFFEEDRPEYDAQAARLAWGQTIEFLHQQLD